VFIGRSTWIVPVLHRAATMSLSTIGLTIRRAGHEALVTKDYISTNLSAEFYIRVEPAEDDVKKGGPHHRHRRGTRQRRAIRTEIAELLEPKLVGALRAVAAQNDFLALHIEPGALRAGGEQGAARGPGAQRLSPWSRSPSPSWRRPRWPRCARTTSSAPRAGRR